jgi:hypothetical protein
MGACMRSSPTSTAVVGAGVTPSSLWSRRWALGMLACWLGFVAFSAASMWLYPGGNWLDPHANGHRFWYNFFCDLSQPVSLSGVNNPLGSKLGQMGIWCFALALSGFFWLVPLLFSDRTSPPVGRWVRRFGLSAVLGVALVPVLPSQRFGYLHGLLALASGALGIAGALVAALVLCREQGPVRWLGWLGALALAVGAVDAGVFAYLLRDSAPPPLLLPAAQKVAAILLSGWMIGVGWCVLRPRPRF